MPLRRPEPDSWALPQAPDRRIQDAAPFPDGGAAAPPVVDWAFVDEALDGLPPATVEAFMADVLADARESLVTLRDPALADDARAQLAHRVKGSARSFGLVGLGTAAAAIEAAAGEGHHLWPALDAYAEAVEATAARLAAGRPPAPAWSRKPAASGGARH